MAGQKKIAKKPRYQGAGAGVVALISTAVGDLAGEGDLILPKLHVFHYFLKQIKHDELDLYLWALITPFH